MIKKFSREISTTQSHYKANIEKKDITQQCSYNLPVDLEEYLLSLGALVEAHGSRRNQKYYLSNQYKLILGDNIFAAIGDSYKKQNNKIIFTHTESEDGGSKKFQLKKTDFHAAGEGFEWFVELYLHNIENTLTVVYVDDEKKTVKIDIELTPYFFKGKTMVEDKPENIDSNMLGTNIILYGVPGCGKSHTIKTEFCSNSKYMQRVVFHPDYTYSDFIGQILPIVTKQENGTENITYNFVPGPFTVALKKAFEDPKNMYYLIIEEINRGNAPAIFGEVFQLLDRENGESEYGITNFDIANEVYADKGHEVKLPRNLTILATMNTADQNVFTLDTAFKRRWIMRSIKNDIANCNHANEYIDGTLVTWYNFTKKINDTIIDISEGNLSSEDNRLGAYFIKEEDLKDRKIFGEKVLMYLWNDAFKYDRSVVFNSEYKTLEDLLIAFEKDGFVVFNSNLEFDTTLIGNTDGSTRYEGDVKEYLSTKNLNFVTVYESLLDLLELKLSTSIDKYTTRSNDHICLRTQGKVIAEVYIQRDKIKVLTKVPNNPEYQIGTKVPDTHNWTLNYSISFTDDSIIETVVDAIIDSQNLN